MKGRIQNLFMAFTILVVIMAPIFVTGPAMGAPVDVETAKQVAAKWFADSARVSLSGHTMAMTVFTSSTSPMEDG